MKFSYPTSIFIFFLSNLHVILLAILFNSGLDIWHNLGQCIPRKNICWGQSQIINLQGSWQWKQRVSSKSKGDKCHERYHNITYFPFFLSLSLSWCVFICYLMSRALWHWTLRVFVGWVETLIDAPLTYSKTAHATHQVPILSPARQQTMGPPAPGIKKSTSSFHFPQP